MKHAPRFFLLGIGTLCFYSISSRVLADDINGFPLMPRVSGMGLGGTDEIVSGEGMAALLGNENGIWLLDAQGKTAFHSSYVGSVGTGLRMVQSDQRILGAYVFGDGNVSATNHEYWFVSPGVESMGTLMDFRMNGYIPVGTQRNLTSTDFADNFGNYNYVTFTAHDQLDAIVNNYEEVGWGLDGEAGIRIAPLNGVRVYAGGYHFNIPNSDDINGFAGRVQFPINSFVEFNVRDSYDNDQHNTIEVGLRFTLGGVNKSPTDPNQPIRERLLDPIERNLATLGQGTAEPVVNEQVVVIPSALERDNIWFFSPSGTDTFMNSTSCTAENPCVNTNFTQATIDAINAGPNSPIIVNPTPSSFPSFYLAPGQYSTLTINGSTATPYTFTDDLVYGRSADFSRPDQAAFLNGAVILNGSDTFDSVIFHNNPNFTQAIGLTLNTGSNLILTNSVVGTDDSTQGYTTAIEMNNATLYASNSQIHAYTNDSATSAVGIHTVGTAGSIINLTNSVITVTADIADITPPGNHLLTAGILLDSTAGDTVTLNHSTINTSAVVGGAEDDAQSAFQATALVSGIDVGLDGSGQENINLLNHSVINASANVTSILEPVVAAGISSDILSNSENAQVVNVNLHDSTINANIIGNDAVVEATGIYLNMLTSSQVNLTNSVINVDVEDNTNNGTALAVGIGLNDAPTQTVQMNNSSVTATVGGDNQTAESYGIYAATPGNLTIGLTNSSVEANANLPVGGVNNTELLAMGISDTSANTTINLSHSQVSANGNIPDNVSTGDLSVIGIDDLTSVSETVTLNSSSKVSATATLGDNTAVDTGTVFGISQNQNGLSTGTVNINGNSQVNTDFELGSFSANSLLAAGIDAEDDTDNINLNNGHMNSQMHMGDNQSVITSVESDNIYGLSNTNLTISAANGSTLNSDLVMDNYDQNIDFLVANNISSNNAGNLVTVNLDDSQLEASLEVKNETNPTGVTILSNNIYVPINNGSLTINILDNSTLSDTSTLDVNGSGTSNTIDAYNINSLGGFTTTISIQNSELNATGIVDTVLGDSYATDINAANISSTAITNTVDVADSKLNVSGEMKDVQNGVSGFNQENITLANMDLSAFSFGSNNVNLSQGSALTAAATYGSLDGSSIIAGMSVDSVDFVSNNTNNITISNDTTLTRTAEVGTNNGATCEASLIGVRGVSSDPGGISSGTVSSNCFTVRNVPFIP